MNKKNTLSSKVKGLLNKFSSGNSEVALEALRQLESVGEISILPSLFERLEKEENSALIKAITDFLGNVQDDGIVDELMNYIRKGLDKKMLSLLLPCVWNSKHNYSAYIADFVALSIEEDYLISLECLTILEQMPGPFEESWLLEAQLFLKEYHESNTAQEDKKMRIISEIALYVKGQNEGVDADLMME